MKHKKMTSADPKQPNFILCDMGIQSAFANMCRNFQSHTPHPEVSPQDWLVIDNDTGEIITPFKNKAHT